MSEARLPLALVCAMAKNRVIGRDTRIPWDLPEDRKHFRALTIGHSVVMGRATWASIGKSLPKRRTIVLSRAPGLVLPGAEVVADLPSALALARQTDSEPRIAGGGQLYAACLPLATRVYLTVLDEDYEGDTFFPELDPRQWQCVEETRGTGASYRTYARRE